jgi:hypothetical protein
VTGRERSLAELGEDLDEIKGTLAALMAELKSGYVPRELYEARHAGLRAEIALEMASMRTEALAIKSAAEGARDLAKWCFGLLAGAVVVALVGFLATGGSM